MKKHLKIAVVFVIVLIMLALPCSALSQDTSYMYDGNNKSYTAPVAYAASRIISGTDMGTTPLGGPEDLYVDKNGTIYIADTKNNRIVVLNSNFEFIREITEYKDGDTVGTLKGPRGVFLFDNQIKEGENSADDDLLFICDTDNHQILALDMDNNVVLRDKGEEIIAVNENLEFKPEKIAVDSDMTIYVVDPNVYQGILQYDRNLNFESFFSPNDVQVSVAVRMANMWKQFFSDEQGDYMQKALPAPYNNLYMSRDNYLYTTAHGVEVGDELKCLNAIGDNVLRTPQTELGEVAFGDLEVSYSGTSVVSSTFVDIHCDENGIITALDQRRGKIFQYDRECNLVCIFGGIGITKGAFDKPIAIDKVGDVYIVLDSFTNSITTFEPTNYIKTVYNALDYYNLGKYTESRGIWEDVLSMNNNYTIAYRSLGRACIQEGEYKLAMEYLKIGNDQYFYSMALKEYRKEFIRSNMWWIAIVVIIAFVGLVIGTKRLRYWLQSKPYPKKRKKG